ncbi:MAG: DUF1707 SHOCT-like domain-containing protein [Trebonia sp.]
MTRDFPAGNMRVSDAERDAALAELSEHFQAGRITQEEFDERSGLALLAKTGNDLRELFTDLPSGEPSREPKVRDTAPVRARRRPPIPLIVIVCVLAASVIGNVTSAVLQGGHHVSVNTGWVVPVIILLIILRRFGRR